jgi:peroxiredoxin Q/BCP
MAPQFSLSDKDGLMHSLLPTRSPWTVVFFYPKDDTPGCTIEAQEFSAQLAEFVRHNVRVFGISGGDNKSKAKFCAKQQLSVPLLSDTDFAVANAYGAFGTKKFMGRSYQGIFRKTFVIDARGAVAAVFEDVKPAGHAKEVLEAIASLRAA